MCDEFGFQKPELFITVCVPLLKVWWRALVAISTAPADPAAAYHRIFHLRGDDGRPIFKTYSLSLVCKFCQSRGMKKKCPHAEGRVPSFHSSDREVLVEKIMRSVGREGDYERESQGVAVSANEACFNPMHVSAMFTPRFTPPSSMQYEFVVMAIDPNSGALDRTSARSSDFAIVTAYRNNHGHSVLLGVTGFPSTGHDDYVAHLKKHVEMVRAYPPTQRALIVVINECNSAKEDIVIRAALRSTGDTRLVFMQEHELKTGVGTYGYLKREMMLQMRDDLKDATIHVDEHAFTTSPGKNLNDELVRLENQLLSFSEIIKPSTDMGKGPQISYHGRRDGADDLAVALMLGQFWFIRFMHSTRYRQYVVGTGNAFWGGRAAQIEAQEETQRKRTRNG